MVNKNLNSKASSGYGKYLVVGVLVVAAVGGYFFGRSFRVGASADKAPYRELEKFAKVLQFVETNYVENVDSKLLIEGAIKGMLSALDPHSNYLSPEVYREMRAETSGKFGGLGIEVTIRDGLITVVAPIEDTPAFKAGIKSGDQIVKIDDKTTKVLSLENTISMMRGKPGTKVKILVNRKGSQKNLEFELVRESIKIQSVKSTRVQNDVGYFRIAQFIEGTSEDLHKAYQKLVAAGPLTGIILDLRANPGGLLDQAVKVSNLFLDEGPVVYTIGKDKTKKEIEYARRGKVITDLPLVVLVDGASASASEIVAGALQDYGRGVLVGQRTFGKGSVQSLVPLDDESGIKLTVSRYYTPSGRSIQAKGITPDVIVEDIDLDALAKVQSPGKRRLREENLEGHFENEASSEEANIAAGEPNPLNTPSFEDRVKRDFMVAQAAGILKTMKLVQGGTKKPQFSYPEESEIKSAKAK